MKPDRTNYEIWLIDYLDGKLDDDQKALLFSFLEENPEIKQEVEGLPAFSSPRKEVIFGNKNSLKRSTAELSETQFDLLCAASLENDLSPEQKEELDEIISSDELRRKRAAQFTGIKLRPPEIIYPFKARLRKLTIAQKVIRLSAIGISVAATLIILLTLLKNPAGSDQLTVTGSPNMATGDVKKGDEKPLIEEQENVPDKKTTNNINAAVNLPANVNSSTADQTKLPTAGETRPDTSVRAGTFQKYEISKLIAVADIPQDNAGVNPELISINLSPVETIDEDQENAVGNFFTRIIREKILKSDSPEKGSLKAYEVADAGINGINKLFGSNISLQKTLDEKGDVKSVYFNSKLLKFNAPVKKAEPLE